MLPPLGARCRACCSNDSGDASEGVKRVLRGCRLRRVELEILLLLGDWLRKGFMNPQEIPYYLINQTLRGSLVRSTSVLLLLTQRKFPRAVRTPPRQFRWLAPYCRLQKIGNSLRATTRAATPPSKQYAPYSPTNMTPIYINKGLFYSSTLRLQNRSLFI